MPCRDPDALPAPQPPLPRPVRRGAAAGGGVGACAHPRRDLSAADAPNRRAPCPWEGAQALVTGDAVGQVASQTLDNLVADRLGGDAAGISAAGGMDKEEVVADAAPHRHLRDVDPARRRLLPAVHAEKSADPRDLRRGRCRGGIVALADLIELAVSGAIVEDFRWPMVQSTARRRLHNHEGTKARRREGHFQCHLHRLKSLFQLFPRSPRSTAMPSRSPARPARPDRPPCAHGCLWRHARDQGHGPVGDSGAGRRQGRPAVVGPRPVSGDGARRGRRVHRAGDEHPDGDLLHGARGVPGGKAGRAGAFIFEIARSEIGYTEQRPHEYAAVVLAAALREGHEGPVFFQGDHVQVNLKNTSRPIATRNSRRCGRSSARRSPPASTTSTSTRPRWSISTRPRSTNSRR